MNTFLIYILESTICISVFCLAFRLLMRKETSFAVNRATLLTIVVASVVVPLIQLPQLMQTPVHVELIPEFSENKIQIQNLPATAEVPSVEVQPSVLESTPVISELTIPLETLLRYFYQLGVLVVLLLFIRNVIQIFLLSQKATVRQMDGYRLLIVEREVPSFAFGRSVIISRTDYEAHGQAILAHEQAHIRLNHFFDLMLLELIKTIHWFNPAVYALIGDMKEIHEFQADEQTLNKGIDATQYQKLIIQKGVGSQRFALANSFNHCQIKKRITMMNKSKNSKAWRWKVATFLPLLALLLMAFGKNVKNITPKMVLCPKGTFAYSGEMLQMPVLNSLKTNVSVDEFWISNEITNKEFRTFYDEIINSADTLSYVDITRMNPSKPSVIKVSCQDIAKTAIDSMIWSVQTEKEQYPNYFRNPKFDDYPVLGVTFQGANYYCLWLTQKVNKVNKDKKKPYIHDFRIPTETEWEYAASHQTKKNSSGYNSQLHSSIEGEMNDFRLFNMGDNVAEWTSSSDVTKGNTFKVVRGGYWKTSWSVKNREIRNENDASNYIGFRIVRSKNDE